MSEEEDKKERFGRYLILDHLVDGGMAKICRARFLGEQADKVVAIKMVQPQFSKDDSFKTMFMDEIKVTFGLLHPNIVQTYDYGLHKEQLYVAMEYCDGRNLKEYLDRLKQKKFVFPVEISAYIISQVCQGLHYAHTYTDKLTGKKANIVHRDISPHNIMLTYDGAIKVIDFGIAKAESNSEATQAGTIKGKLSYLAPEYLEGSDLDPNYDQFAVGITLWEMLCSRKLFKAANDLAVLKKIQECKVPPPSSINPNVPKELDEIVLKALKKDRSKRFENMEKFNRALIKFLYANYPEFNSSDLSYFAKELFKEEIKKDKEKLFEFGKIDIKPYLEDLKAEQDGGGGSSFSSSSGPGGERKTENVLDFGFEEEDPTKTKTTKRKRTSLKDAGGNIQLDPTGTGVNPLEIGAAKPKASPAAGGTGPGARGQTRTNIKIKQKGQTGTRSSTTRVKIKKPKKGSSVKSLLLIASLAVAVYMGKDQIPFVKDFIGTAQNAEVVKVQNVTPEDDDIKKTDQGKKILSNMSSTDTIVKVRLTNFDKHSQKIYLNSKIVTPDILQQISMPIGEESVVRVEKPGFKHFVKFMTPEAGQDYEIDVPSMEPEVFGYVYTGKGCRLRGQLIFELYGEKRTETLPIISKMGIALPIKGDGRYPADESGSAQYTLYYKKAKENIQRKIEVKFSEGDERIDLCEI